MKKKTQHRVKGLWLNGRMMRLIYSNMAFLPTWSRILNSSKISTTQTGNKFLRLCPPKIPRSATRDGCSSRSSAATRPNGQRLRMISLWPRLLAMALETGQTLQRNWMMLLLNTSRMQSQVTKIKSHLPQEMVNSAVRDGWQPWTHQSTKSNGIFKKISISWKNGSMSETNGEKSQTWSKVELSLK